MRMNDLPNNMGRRLWPQREDRTCLYKKGGQKERAMGIGTCLMAVGEILRKIDLCWTEILNSHSPPMGLYSWLNPSCHRNSVSLCNCCEKGFTAHPGFFGRRRRLPELDLERDSLYCTFICFCVRFRFWIPPLNVIWAIATFVKNCHLHKKEPFHKLYDSFI